VYKGCLKLVNKLLKNQQTVQYAELKKFTNFTPQIFLLLIPEMTANFRSYIMTLFHLYVSDPETIAIFLVSLDLKILNTFCQNMVCAPSVHKNPEFLQLESL